MWLWTDVVSTLLIEVAVVGMLGWLITLYVAIRRWFHWQQTWCWWHAQHISRLHHQAEFIRDDLLQQTFGFRRYLENSLTTSPDAAQIEQCLDQLHTFYQTLEQLSNQLSPPFVADSLPLALQFMMSTWQQAHPGLKVQMESPTHWPKSTSDNNQVILLIVTETLKLLTHTDHREQVLHVVLACQKDGSSLTFSQENSRFQTATSTETNKHQHLKNVFYGLMAGQLKVDTTDTLTTFRLFWQENHQGLSEIATTNIER